MGGGKSRKREPNLAKGKGHRAAINNPPPPARSALVDYLLKQWSWGHMSPQQVQKICHLAMLDFRKYVDAGDAPELERVARIGDSGALPNHCNRDLQNILTRTHLPDPYCFNLVCKTSQPGVHAPLQFSCLLPHEWFAAVHSHYKPFFDKHICAGTDDMEAFWRDVAAHPVLRDNVATEVPDWRSKFIPISLHGDGVPVKGVGKSWSESFTSWSWASVIAPSGTTLQANFLIGGIFDHLVNREGAFKTMNKFWKILAWSFTALYNGKWPTVSWDGKPIHSSLAGSELASGKRCLLIALKGDLEYMAKDGG